MKHIKKTQNSLLMLSLIAVLLCLAACSTVSPQTSGKGKDLASPAASPPLPGDIESFAAYAEGVPGGVIAKTMEINARVTAIDHFNREATLMRSDGKEITVKVGPEAVNFDKIEKGDLVKVTVAEQLVVFVDDEHATHIGGSASVVALGAQAGGLVSETREIVATVSKIDHENRTATLLFQDGSAKTFPVRGDIDLSRHKIGEQVVFQITEMVAIDIEKP